eukprot:TRINITY_DN46092_c0_g1_i1.p1 TRINITY_DN46092_c0_g1~~TRINITY_DN46092_c0_g1_i1.p1  ORF type:complete len:483 (-),score=58.09 TRINITY_DN46092_c0_g1_i1:1055-2419(-)
MASRWLGTWSTVLAVVRGDQQALLVPSSCDKHMAHDFGWLSNYIEVGFFTDYRLQAWRFFELNETSYAFLWLNSIAFANIDFVKEVCPVAARLALLIRAEERLPMRESEASLLDYATFAEFGPSFAEASWPLGKGLRRLQLLQHDLAVASEYSVDVVMPYCDEPLDELLSKSVGYEDEWLAGRVPFGHVNLLLYRLMVCSPVNERGEVDPTRLSARAMSAAMHFKSVEVIPVDASPKAWEVARYLVHLASRYERLADFTIFLHPDVFEHVNPRTLRNVLQALRVGGFHRSGLGDDQRETESSSAWYGYSSLSHHYMTRPSRVHSPSSDCAEVDLAFKDLHKKVFSAEAPHGSQGRHSQSESSDKKVEVLGDFGFYCCSQFMVHRNRVRKRPREWYERLADQIPWEHCATSYMELLWHGIFNDGTLHEEKRQDRTDLPLFLRVDNFIESTTDGRT